MKIERSIFSNVVSSRLFAKRLFSAELSKCSSFLEPINYATFNRIKSLNTNYRIFTFLSNSLSLLGANQYTRYQVSSGLKEDYKKIAFALARVTE